MPRITKRRLWLIVALAIFVLGATASVARADETPVSIDQYKQRLDIARATLDEVSKALAESGASADALRVLRERVAPLPGDLDDVVQKLAPRLTAIDARLKELSGPGAAASPAPAATEQAQRPAPAPPPSQAPTHKPTAHGQGGQELDAAETPRAGCSHCSSANHGFRRRRARRRPDGAASALR